jgi:type II secretory pathway component GspD/PulD (secretin)
VKNQETETREKIPFFGDIPLIGVFFRKNVKTRTKSNLVVYITPHIIPKDNSVDLKQSLYNLDKNNMEFMDRKIDDLFHKKAVSEKPDSSKAAAGDRPADRPAKQSPVKQDSMKTVQ